MSFEYVLIALLLGITLHQYFKLTQIKNIPDLSKEKEFEIKQQNQALQNEIEHRQKLKERDYKVMYDPLTPGERRLPSHLYPRGLFKDMINVPTRGQPDNFQYVGNLVRDTDEKILPVFARQDYPGSDYYEYYLMINQDGNFGIKIPINDGEKRREIQNDETVKVDYFKEDKGDFRFKEFDYDVPRYNPYDY